MSCMNEKRWEKIYKNQAVHSRQNWTFSRQKNLDFPALFDIWGISIWISRTFWHLRIFNLNFPHFLTFEDFQFVFSRFVKHLSISIWIFPHFSTTFEISIWIFPHFQIFPDFPYESPEFSDIWGIVIWIFPHFLKFKEFQFEFSSTFCSAQVEQKSPRKFKVPKFLTFFCAWSCPKKG